MPNKPTKLTRAVIDKIVDFIKDGASYETACKAAGVSRTSLYRWMDLAETEGGLYAELKERVEQQTAMTNAELVGLIKKCALGDKEEGISPDWKAAEALLRARMPHEWNPRVVEHNLTKGRIGPASPAEAKVEELIAKMAVDELYSLIRPLLARQEGAGTPLIAISGPEEAPPVHQVRVPRLPVDATFREISGSAGGGDVRADQETDYLDASEAREVAP